MNTPAPGRRLILRCRMCQLDGHLIEPTSEHPTYAAADHAMDHHLEWLLSDPDGALATITVAA